MIQFANPDVVFALLLADLGFMAIEFIARMVNLATRNYPYASYNTRATDAIYAVLGVLLIAVTVWAIWGV